MSTTPSALKLFMQSIKNKQVLTKDEEKQCFESINKIRKDIPGILNRTAVIYTKIPLMLTFKNTVGFKEYINVHQHSTKATETVKVLKENLLKYASVYEEFVETQTVQKLQELTNLCDIIKFSDDFYENCCGELMGTPHDEALDLFILTSDELKSVRSDLGTKMKQMRVFKDKVLECNLRLVVSIAQKFQKQNSHQDLLDLIQEGTFGLIKAIDRFDVSSNNKFSTLATWWIRQSIMRSIQDDSKSIRLPVAVQDDYSKIRRFIAEYMDDNGRPPKEAEIIQALGMSAGRYNDVINAQAKMTSTSTPIGDDDESGTFEDLIPDYSHTDGYIELVDQQQKDQLSLAMEILEGYERVLIEMRYGFEEDPKSLDEIATLIGCTAYEVQKIEQEALEKIKEALVELNTN